MELPPSDHPGHKAARVRRIIRIILDDGPMFKQFPDIVTGDPSLEHLAQRMHPEYEMAE